MHRRIARRSIVGKFAIDIRHPLAWSVVQELAHVLDYLSVDERLPWIVADVHPDSSLQREATYATRFTFGRKRGEVREARRWRGRPNAGRAGTPSSQL
jgi:hypothetical protein